MADVTFGMSKILIGTPAVDGGMSTTLSEKFGHTVRDSVNITTEEGTVNEIFIEESQTAIISQATPGAMRIAFSTYNNEPEALVFAFGGTVTGTGSNKVWNSPANIQPLTQSVRIEDASGNYWAMAKVSLLARLNMNFQRGDAGKIDFTGTVLIPDKAGVMPIVRGKIAV